MNRHRPAIANEVIYLSSDSDDDVPPGGHEPRGVHAGGLGLVEDIPDVDHILGELNARYSPAYGAADSVIDLSNIPGYDSPDPNLALEDEGREDDHTGSGANQPVPEAVCLQMVLDVLPGISTKYALKFIQDQTSDQSRTVEDCQRVITQLLEGNPYPKEADEVKNRKRKRDNDDEWADYEDAGPDPTIETYEEDAINLLKDEFQFVPVRHITNIMKEQKTLFKAYVILEEQVRLHSRIASQFSKTGKARVQRGIEMLLIEQGSQIPKELDAAKKKVAGEIAKRQRAEEAEQAEQNNLKQAQDNNEMGECACCFNEVPFNRMISCSGEEVHLYCRECPKRHIETQMGQSRCKPNCFGVEDCNGTFSRHQLQEVLCEKTFERLEHMQQMEDLAAAGLDFLSECPFCDFKMECPPVEVDKEFRCQKTNCGKTSCRLCQKETHIPLSCEEAKKDGQLTLRHVIEEAMSAALIRQCNRCKHPFVKELGCNKMTCTHCGNVQCYVCSKNVANYEHFGDVARGRCPLQENVEQRHEEEVKKAADEALAKVRTENPEISDADLMIQVSDRVKKAEEERKGRAQARVAAFPYHMVENELRRRPEVEAPMPPDGPRGIDRFRRGIPPVARQPAPQNVPPRNNPIAPAPPMLLANAMQYPIPLLPHQWPPPPLNIPQHPRREQADANANAPGQRPENPLIRLQREQVLYEQQRLQMMLQQQQQQQQQQRQPPLQGQQQQMQREREMLQQIWRREHERRMRGNNEHVPPRPPQGDVLPRRR